MLSIPHLIIIFVVALVVFGPEKLPELARTLGKVMGEFRRATGDLRLTFEDHLRDLEREAENRKIGGSLPPTKHAEGTVATSAPNHLAADASQNPDSTPASGVEAASGASPPQEPAHSSEGASELASDLTSETHTDGGARTA
jgi:sec-independent protein translocase protein TatB